METGVNSRLKIVKDNSFTHEVSGEHVLCLDLTSLEVKAGVFNHSNNALVATLEHTGVLNGESLLEDEIFNLEFHKILGVYHTNKSFLSSYKVEDSAFSSIFISELNGYFNYVKSDAVSVLMQRFPQSILNPFGVQFLKSAIQRNRYQKGQKIYVHLTEKCLYLMHFSNEKLTMYSSENLANLDESIYYISKAIELTGFDQLESKCYLSGSLKEEGQIHTYVKERVKNTYLNKGFKFQKSAMSLAKVQKQNYFSIINSFQCV